MMAPRQSQAIGTRLPHPQDPSPKRRERHPAAAAARLPPARAPHPCSRPDLLARALAHRRRRTLLRPKLARYLPRDRPPQASRPHRPGRHHHPDHPLRPGQKAIYQALSLSITPLSRVAAFDPHMKPARRTATAWVHDHAPLSPHFPQLKYPMHGTCDCELRNPGTQSGTCQDRRSHDDGTRTSPRCLYRLRTPVYRAYARRKEKERNHVPSHRGRDEGDRRRTDGAQCCRTRYARARRVV